MELLVILSSNTQLNTALNNDANYQWMCEQLIALPVIDLFFFNKQTNSPPCVTHSFYRPGEGILVNLKVWEESTFLPFFPLPQGQPQFQSSTASASWHRHLNWSEQLIFLAVEPWQAGQGRGGEGPGEKRAGERQSLIL